ncbi:hypothetical protein TIFTF001_001378 [Ficus carica]|uniref:Uncharacterized protein n=1 Tax=Ficus carica TaxID=3494 RepID=A0AA88CLY7_FICCA|nr:hypothetical protein TIFTF001_001378 [Ficus carica]
MEGKRLAMAWARNEDVRDKTKRLTTTSSISRRPNLVTGKGLPWYRVDSSGWARQSRFRGLGKGDGWREYLDLVKFYSIFFFFFFRSSRNPSDGETSPPSRAHNKSGHRRELTPLCFSQATATSTCHSTIVTP